MPEQGKSILTSFLRRLTNLSGNNRGLLLLRLTADQFIDVQNFSYLNSLKAFEILKSVVAGESFKLCAVHDSRLEANNLSSEKLKMLQRIDKQVYEERGTNDLHVGWPFIKGKFSDGTLVRCPLLYFPVSIVQQGKYWVLEPRTDAGITFNKSFLLAYAFYHKLRVDEELLEFTFDDFEKDIQGFRTQLYQLLDNRIELNFNRENLQDELLPFTPYKRSEFDEHHKAGELKLFPEAVLGIFPQTGSQLVPDYLHLLESESFVDLETFFTNDQSTDKETREQPKEGLIREEKLFTPFPLDAFQERAIHLSRQGKSLVVQGPPGTGKSQLICNLLADAMADGKKVLLVCQKRAALDVVYERMNSFGLAPFLGLVHDFRNDRRQIFDKIAQQIDRIEEYKSRNRGIDVIQTERKFFQVCRGIDQITEELQEFRKALFFDEECGTSVKQLYLSSDPGADSVSLKQEYSFFLFPEDEFIRKLRRYAQYALKYEKPGHPWMGRKSFASLQASDQRTLENTLDEIVNLQNHIAASVFRLTGSSLNLLEGEELLGRKSEIESMLELLREDGVYNYFQHMSVQTEEEASLLWLTNIERITLKCFDDIGPETTLTTDKLGKFQEALYERMKVNGNIFRRLHWEFFSEHKFIVKRVLVANDLAYNKYGLTVLEQRIDTRLNLEHHLTSIRNRAWLKDLPHDYKKDKLQHWFDLQKDAIKAKTLFHSLREISGSINPAVLSKEEFHSLFKNLLNLLGVIPAARAGWQRYLSTYHIRKVIADTDEVVNLKKSLREDYDNLCEFDQLKDGLHTTEVTVINRLHEHISAWNADQLESLFKNSIRLAWIDHLEIKYPILRSVSSMKMEEMQKELQRLVKEKQDLSLEILQIRAREHTSNDLAYNRLNNLVTYRDLQHQVTKKKKLWPLRKLLSTYHEELFRLVPCWMASPESVSAIFPMEPLFDLVIFDEASQCFSERGIPAMYRGKQVLVAGDRQQLKPSELYQVRWTEDENDSPDTEVESLLELSERYLPTVHLQGHYRSKSFELMEFSNRHFYKGRLRLLPDQRVMNLREPAIEYIKVNGTWENQTNRIEADAVVAKVIELSQRYPAKEIGIVTFNAPQQNLILDILEDTLEKEGLVSPPRLFVKNIENVQGDEKDIIIFSTGYAPDVKGKMVMMFGSLGIMGGENRLNVAVTRAREKVIMVTSVWPEQLHTKDLKNQGPRLLQEYLQFAREVSERKFTPPRITFTASDNGLNLGSRIRQWGTARLDGFVFEEHTLPYADVNIMKEDNYLAVLLTDDQRYQSSLSIKDIYAYTPALLSRKNWPYRYIYSRQYWKDLPVLEQSLMYFIGVSDQKG